MRADIAPYPLDRERSVTITVYPKTETFVDVINGVASNGFSLHPFVTSARHTARDCTLVLTWDGTGAFLANQPKPGDLLEVKENSAQLWIGVIDEIQQFNEERGNRLINILARSRDGVGPWRQARYTSQRFVSGATLTGVATIIMTKQGLSLEEFDAPLGGYTIPHDNVQFVDMNPWSMLEMLGLAMGVTPFTDARGRIKFYSREVNRVADLVLTNEQVLRIQGGKGQPSLTTFRIKWLDRNLTEVVQQSQILGKEVIPAGFFKRVQERDVYWSEDRRSRAKNTVMRTIQSINDGLLPIGSEDYEQIDRFHGTITVEVSAFIQGLATVSLAAVLALDNTPDGVVTAGIAGFGGGYTVPYGRVVRGIAEGALLLIMMSLGVGTYEVWGEPYDFVHAVNKTEAFDNSAPYWQEKVVEIENDLVYDETHAQEIAIRELLHRVAETNRWDTIIADDPRIEPGDILELPDTSRLYVVDYERNLMRGSPSQLIVRGFRV